MFCKHDWKVLSETTTKSKFESSVEVLEKAGIAPSKIPHQLADAERKIIQIVSCDKCGKLKRFVTDI